MFLKYLLLIITFLSFNLVAADCEKPKMPSDYEWNEWLDKIKIEAIQLGISKETVLTNLNKVKPQSKIIMRDRCQPESTITLNEYLYYRVDKARIVAGQNMLHNYRELLNEIGDHFKIQPRFIVAILGMESFYGRNQA